MCRIHHKIIDDQPNTYTVKYLKEKKGTHEKWVRESLSGYDNQKQKDEELYASYIESWLELAYVDNWNVWSSGILSGDHPSLFVYVDKSLLYLREWIFSRIWPKRYPEIEGAFENFRRVLEDFQNTFYKYSEESGDMLWTSKFYKIDEWNKEKYELLSMKYIFHVKLVQDLMLELTRAANYICDKARKFISPTFRLKEGIIIVESGPYIDISLGMSWRKHRVEYRGKEKSLNPYPGLEKFKKVRVHRDYSFGVGIDIDDPYFKEWYSKS